MQGCLIEFYPEQNFQSWSQSSQTLLLLYQLSLCDILNPLCCSNSLHRIFSLCRVPFKKSLSLLTFKMQFLTLWSFIMRLQHSVTSSAPLLVLSLFPPPLQLLPPLKFWTPQSYSWRLEAPSPKLLLMLIFWPLSFNHKCSSVQLLSRIWLFATAWTTAHLASLSITNSRGLLKLTSIESVMPFKTISSSVIFLFCFNLSQHQCLFKWVISSHQVAKVLEFQLQHQSFQWIFRTDFL